MFIKRKAIDLVRRCCEIPSANKKDTALKITVSSMTFAFFRQILSHTIGKESLNQYRRASRSQTGYSVQAPP